LDHVTPSASVSSAAAARTRAFSRILSAAVTTVASVPAEEACCSGARPRSGLRDAGLDEESIARIHAPCGLDVGARTPSETAISVLAEVIAVRTGRAGESLRETTGPIHAETAPDSGAV
jgi:hypothetical protein